MGINICCLLLILVPSLCSSCLYIIPCSTQLLLCTNYGLFSCCERTAVFPNQIIDLYGETNGLCEAYVLCVYTCMYVCISPVAVYQTWLNRIAPNWKISKGIGKSKHKIFRCAARTVEQFTVRMVNSACPLAGEEGGILISEKCSTWVHGKPFYMSL